MVAKTVRLISLIAVLFAAGCQTIPVGESSNDARRQSNEPKNTEMPTTAVDTENGIALTEEVDRSVQDSVTNNEGPNQPSVNTVEAEAQEATTQPSPNLVVTRLQQQALQLQSEGRWREAELILERALRINADKVDLYHQMATVRLGQQRFTEAEQIALKGLSLTDETPKYKASLWEVIAQCRSAMGDVPGATEAREEMRYWMSAE